MLSPRRQRRWRPFEWASWLLLAAHRDRRRLAVLEIGNPFGYCGVTIRRQGEIAAVLLERMRRVAEIEVVEDAEVQRRGGVARIQRDRLLVGVARVRELALLAIGDAELVPVDRLSRAEAERLLELLRRV